jgi:hypothetical protein
VSIEEKAPSKERLAVRVDVHQHLWTEGFIAALRERADAPRLAGDGWTLVLDGEPDYRVDPRDHDPALRLATNRADRLDLALISLSSPLGVEHLPAAEAAPLLEAYHRGALSLPAGFGAWAAACVTDPEPADLEHWLDAGCVGLQLPATALADAAGYARCAPLLHALQERGKPLFIHAGRAASPGAPPWWAANVDYVQQMHAAYYAFAAFGRPAHPTLKVCFAMLSGLAPLHRERAAARGGPDLAADSRVWFETSSYGPTAVAALGTALDAAGGGHTPPEAGFGHEQTIGARAASLSRARIVLGSDRPYAAPAILADPAAAHAAAAELLGARAVTGQTVTDAS